MNGQDAPGEQNAPAPVSTNTRRIRSALAPLLKDAPLSKDAVSRLTGRLAATLLRGASRDLAEDQIRYLFLDG